MVFHFYPGFDLFFGCDKMTHHLADSHPDVDISLCMATYGGMPYVVEQIESILVQLGANDEFIVSDHGSRDGTWEYLKSLQDVRIRVYQFDGPRGPIANFENALRKATRPVVTLADQDDLWLPNRLELIRRAFRATDGIRLLVTDGHRIDADGALLHGSNLAFLRFRKGFWNNLFRNSYMGCCLAFSRDLLDIALPFPKGIPMHDSWLGMLGEIFGRVDIEHEVSYCYRVHGGNISHRHNSTWVKLMHRIRLFLSIIPRITVYKIKGLG